MAQQKGATAKVLMGFESAYKTVATAGFVMPFNTSGVKGSQALKKAATMNGSRNPVAPFDGNRNVSGPLVVPVDSVAMWYWLKAMFGDPGTTGEDPYVHEFKIGSTMPSFSLEHQFTDLATDKYVRHLGCKIGGFSMELGGDDELTASLDVVGASESLETSSFDGSPTDLTLARVENFEAALTEGGGSLANATSVSCNVNFGLDESTYVIGGSGVRYNLPEGDVEVTGNLKALFEDDTLLNKAINGTESSLKLTVTSSASSIFELEFQELRYERNSPDIPGPQGLLVDLNWQAYYVDGSEASAIVARVTNGDAHA